MMNNKRMKNTVPLLVAATTTALILAILVIIQPLLYSLTISTTTTRESSAETKPVIIEEEAVAFTTTNYKIETKKQSKKKKPLLQVFIMVGQSNMNGHGWVDTKDEETGQYLNGTLEWMVQQDQYANVHLKNNNNEWIVRDDIWIAYNKQYYIHDIEPIMNVYGENFTIRNGKYGGDPGQFNQMGPEIGFGWTLGDNLYSNNDENENDNHKQPILLLKIAWGGKSLAIDYRPPSSSGVGGNGGGQYYQAMINNIHTTLNKLSYYFPSYNNKFNGYEIAGFVWHQGWNDGCNTTQVQEYETNLVHLINDVRNEFNVPTLPFIIGASGMCGGGGSDSGKGNGNNNNNIPYICEKSEILNRNGIIHAQLSMNNHTKYPTFYNNVIAIDTRNFARLSSQSSSSPSNNVYHWNNNCESYWLIGQAMGYAMIQLLSLQQKRNGKIINKTTTTTQTTKTTIKI